MLQKSVHASGFSVECSQRDWLQVVLQNQTVSDLFLSCCCAARNISSLKSANIIFAVALFAFLFRFTSWSSWISSSCQEFASRPSARSYPTVDCLPIFGNDALHSLQVWDILIRFDFVAAAAERHSQGGSEMEEGWEVWHYKHFLCDIFFMISSWTKLKTEKVSQEVKGKRDRKLSSAHQIRWIGFRCLDNSNLLDSLGIDRYHDITPRSPNLWKMFTWSSSMGEWLNGWRAALTTTIWSKTALYYIREALPLP